MFFIEKLVNFQHVDSMLESSFIAIVLLTMRRNYHMHKSNTLPTPKIMRLYLINLFSSSILKETAEGTTSEMVMPLMVLLVFRP